MDAGALSGMALVEAALNCEVLHHEQLSVCFCFSGQHGSTLGGG